MTSPTGNKKKTTVRASSKTTPCCSKVGLKRGPWTAEEDEILASYIKREGEGRWRTLPKKAGLLRCGKSCRLRWMNYLRPSVKRGHISLDEEDLILRLHRLLGNRWSLIAGRIPGRTDNEIKNYWNTHLSKKLISQGIDPRTHKPLNHIPSHDNDNFINKTKAVPKLVTTAHLASSSSLEKDSINPKVVSVDGENGGYVNNNSLGDDHHDDLYNQVQTGCDDDDMNYCTEDVFSSFLNSLINEDPFATSQPQQQPGIDDADANAASTSSGIPMIIMSSGFGCNEPEEN